MYKVTVSKKETPTDVKTFYMTSILKDETCCLNHRFNYYAIEKFDIYGIPAHIKLMTKDEAETFFNIKINWI